MAASRSRLFRIIVVLAGGVLLGAQSSMMAQSSDAADKWRRANDLMQAGKPDQAIPLYRELAAAFPRDTSFGINLAIAQYKAHLYRDAIEECGALLKLQPKLFSAWLFLGASELELDDAASAVVALRKAADLSPGDRNARLMLADALLAQDRYAEAADDFEEAKQTMPDSPRVWYGLNRSYEALAVEVSDRLEKTAPGSPELLALSGDVELERQQFARALQRYRQALAARPSLPGVRESVFMIYEKTGHTDWALVERQKETPVAPDCVSQSLECQFNAGDFREIVKAAASTPAEMYWQAKAFLSLSRQAYMRLQELPPSRETYEAAARVDERMGRWPEAAAKWKEALRLSPEDTKIPRKLALALCRSNDCTSALPFLKDAIVREPSSAELNFLYGIALSGAQEARRAVPYLETAVKIDGNLLDARAALGEAYLEAGEPERAIPQLEKAIAEDTDGSRHYQLGRAYQSAGKQEQAGAALREYREILRRRDAVPANDARITPP